MKFPKKIAYLPKLKIPKFFIIGAGIFIIVVLSLFLGESSLDSPGTNNLVSYLPPSAIRFLGAYVSSAEASMVCPGGNDWSTSVILTYLRNRPWDRESPPGTSCPGIPNYVVAACRNAFTETGPGGCPCPNGRRDASWSGKDPLCIAETVMWIESMGNWNESNSLNSDGSIDRGLYQFNSDTFQSASHVGAKWITGLHETGRGFIVNKNWDLCTPPVISPLHRTDGDLTPDYYIWDPFVQVDIFYYQAYFRDYSCGNWPSSCTTAQIQCPTL